MSLIAVKRSDFGYGTGRGFVPIVHNVTLSVAKGGFLLLCGANGSGKSTLMKGLLGLCEVRGSVHYGCTHDKIGYVPQENHIALDTPATVLDIIMLAAPKQTKTEKVHAVQLLEQIGLTAKARERFGHLSGGQKRRVLLARALMNNPELVIMDEPTAFADKESIATIERILHELRTIKGVGIIASTHAGGWAEGATLFDVEAHNG